MPATLETRELRPSDLDEVAAIDQAITGRVRRGFYARRFASLAGEATPFFGVGATERGLLRGFALAHVLDGEFGGRAPVGVLDAIGVDPAAARQGAARAMTAALEALLAGRGVRELRTEAEWTQHELISFFSGRGFRLSPRLVLERGVEERLPEPPLDSPEELSWNALPVRSMTREDLPAIVRVDQKITGQNRAAYYRRKAAEALEQSAVRVSLVAEVQGQFAGFLMARVDSGEFGRTEPTAVLDTVGVEPAFARKRVGHALLEQLLLNLGSLRLERLVTQVEWNDLPLLGFLDRTGFRRSQRLSFEKPVSAGGRA
jgi:ribosomal protein S18 acetylase RimI-like enzyme